MYVLQSTRYKFSKIIVHEKSDKKDKDVLKHIEIKKTNFSVIKGLKPFY